MDILLNGLPKSIKVEDEIYPIRCDYKTGLKLINIFEDKDLSSFEKTSLLIKLLYVQTPKNILKAVEQGIKFLDCGEKRTDRKICHDCERMYSFISDANYIFPAIDRQLDGRIGRGDFVHWWEFVMAFMNLPEDCQFSKILYYRIQFSKGKLSKEERKIYYENLDMFELPENLTRNELRVQDEFLKKLKGE